MPIQVDNQEIHRTHLSFDEIYNQKFYEIQNSRTTSSLDNLTGEILYLNFKNKKNNQIQYVTDKVKNDISQQIETIIVDLPIYYNENKQKLNILYQNILSKKEFSTVEVENIEKNFLLLSDNISELNFNDIHLEITKSDIIKFTAVFDINKILILSKDVSDVDTDIIYSYFINRQLIASDVADISLFTKKFKEYLSL
jgi:hypothetical protein